MLESCRYGYGNFKKQKTTILSHNMIFNTTVQIFRLLLSRKCVCRLVPINCDFSWPAVRVRLMTCRLIGNYHDREFTLYLIWVLVWKLCRCTYETLINAFCTTQQFDKILLQPNIRAKKKKCDTCVGKQAEFHVMHARCFDTLWLYCTPLPSPASHVCV